MTSNKMGFWRKSQAMDPTDDNSMAKSEPISLLKKNVMNRSLISRNSVAEMMTNSKPSTMLQSYNRSATTNNQNIFMNSSSVSNVDRFVPSTIPSVPKIPSPKIPMQFQLAAAKLNYIKSPKSVAFDMKRNDTVPIVTTSGTNSTTVIHTNRSLVYSEPVSTKGTAPTKNIIEIDSSRFGATSFLNNPNDSTFSSRFGIAQNITTKAPEFRAKSTYTSLLPGITSNSVNESVKGTGNSLSHTNQAHLEKKFDVSIPNQNLDTNIYRNIQNKHSEQVNNRSKMFFVLYFSL